MLEALGDSLVDCADSAVAIFAMTAPVAVRDPLGMVTHESTPYGSEPTALLTINDVARRLAISRDSVYRLVASGGLPSFRIGARLRFRVEDLESYIERGREPVEAA